MNFSPVGFRVSGVKIIETLRCTTRTRRREERVEWNEEDHDTFYAAENQRRVLVRNRQERNTFKVVVVSGVSHANHLSHGFRDKVFTIKFTSKSSSSVVLVFW